MPCNRSAPVSGVWLPAADERSSWPVYDPNPVHLITIIVNALKGSEYLSKPTSPSNPRLGIHKQEVKRGNMLESNSFGLVNVIEMVSKVSRVSEISMIQVLGDDPG